MKSYLCLLLLALITCQTLDKNNEIILKASDIVRETFETIADIFVDCNYDENCISNRLFDYVTSLTDEEYLEIEEFLETDECNGVCVEILSKKVSEEITNIYCSNVCYQY